jgi:hypothetical protein
MVVIPAPRAGLGVAAGPSANVYRINPWDVTLALGKGVSGEQIPQSVGVEAPFAQSRVEAAPAAAVYGRQAKMDRGRSSTRRQDRIGELEECVGASPEAIVKRLTKSAER